MPSKSNVVSSWMIHNAVYWSGAESDGYGGSTFDDPIQIKVRWDDLMTISSSPNGSELVSDASVRSLVPLEPGCLIWKGELLDLDSIEAAAPLTKKGTKEVISCSAIADLRGEMIYYRSSLGASRGAVR